MDKVQAALVKYNANSRNNRVGDCVKRALSVAYSMDYDAVGAELNRIKRAIGGYEYNDLSVFTKFMRNRGDKFTKLSPSKYITVADFADLHTSGVWLILCGKSINNRDTSHLLAIVNGDVYDSWNSMGYYVKDYANVSSGRSDVYEADWSDVANNVAHNVYDYVMFTLKDKQLSCMDVSCEQTATGKNHTYQVYMSCKLGEVPQSCKYYSNRKYGHYIIIKINPRLSEDENISILTKKCKQKAYDWLYNMKDNIVQHQKAEALITHEKFRGDRILLLKCPEWARPYIHWTYDRGSVMSQDSYNYWPRFEVDMYPLPDDPRQKDSWTRHSSVHFEADTLRDLREQFEMYKEDYSRPGYDY